MLLYWRGGGVIHCFLQITNLLESDVFCILSETLTAHVDTILSDQTMSVRANSAMYKYKARLYTGQKSVKLE